MKKIAILLIIGTLTTTLTAQNLPRTSPSSKINQVVGLTEFSIDYSRPSVKGRTIFGELVPYDKVWRLGANECTKMTTSTNVKIGESILKPATYALFAIPSKSGEWTIAFNSNIEQWGSTEYDATKNIGTIKVKAFENSFTETLTIGFNNLTNNSGVISIKWDKLMINIPFTVDTDKIASQNITDAIEKGENLADVYKNAADYYKGAKNNSMALTFIEKSIGIEKNHKNIFLKAEILKEMGEKDKAIKLAKEAIELAKEAKSNGWVNYISGTIEEWRK